MCKADLPMWGIHISTLPSLNSITIIAPTSSNIYHLRSENSRNAEIRFSGNSINLISIGYLKSFPRWDHAKDTKSSALDWRWSDPIK